MSTVHSPIPAGHIPVTNYSSDNLSDKGVAALSPCIIKEIRVTNASGGTRYLHLFNMSVVPADGSTPSLIPIPILNGATVSISYPEGGRYFSTGLSWCSSTTQTTKTLGGADFWLEADYVNAN